MMYSTLCVFLCARLISVASNLVSKVHLGEAKGLQVGAGVPDGRSNGLYQQLLQILAHKGPYLLQHLHGWARAYARQTVITQ